MKNVVNGSSRSDARPARAGARPPASRRSALLPSSRRPGPAWPALPERAWRLLALAALGLGGACAAYLSLRSTGRLATVPWLPRWAVDWADEHGRLRNLPAYALLTVPVMLLDARSRVRAWGALAAGLFGTGLEFAEVFVPARMVEWQDIAWTWAGVGAAWLVFEGAGRLPGCVRQFRKSPA